MEDLETRLGQGGRKAGPGGISPRIFEDCVTIFEGYSAVDSILQDCEDVGTELRSVFASWSSAGKGKGKEVVSAVGSASTSEDGAIDLTALDIPSSASAESNGYLVEQPALLSTGVTLKDYQLLGVNWLNLLYNRNTSCILADEMGT